MAIKNGAFKVKNISTGEIDEVMLKTTLAQVDGLNKLTGATANAAGVWGLAPAPAKGSQNLPLCGDAKYKVLPVEGGGTGASKASDALSNLGAYNAISIPANSDLDNYKTGGFYSCTNTTNAQSLKNNPMSSLSTGIILEVIVDNNLAYQKIYGTLVRGMYTRRYHDGTWNTWKNINNGLTLSYLNATSGYIQFENNIVIAWKRVGISNGGTTVTKPIPFTTYCVAFGDYNTSEGSPSTFCVDLAKTTTTTDKFYKNSSYEPDYTCIIWIGYAG